mmetsp:Transcript_4218/g.12889  ORF Transcript_4218/g.12889 Transcript_4218/m.12889 type:complete len:341 (+) Transcript_4218:1299-2321(+)
MSDGDVINVGELLSACIDAAQRAGEEIRKVWMSGDLQIKDKGGNDPMTVADIRAQQLIVGTLERIWPRLQIVGEEDCATPATDIDLRRDLLPVSALVPESLRAVPAQDVVIFIDPLDATKEFTLGRVEAVITLIGIAVCGVPAAGVMYQPFVDEGRTMYGLCATGLLVGVTSPTQSGANQTSPATATTVSDSSSSSSPSSSSSSSSSTTSELVAVSSLSHPSAQLSALLARLNADRNLPVGGCGHKVLKVMEGEANVYVGTGGTKKWDTCAPSALLHCAGGRLTDLAGQPLRYFCGGRDEMENRLGLVATAAGVDHDEIIARLAVPDQESFDALKTPPPA